MRNTSTPLTGSSLLKFNPQGLWRKAFHDKTKKTDFASAREDLQVPDINRLIRHQSVYLSEPDDVRKCMEKFNPHDVLCLILLNEIP